MAHAIAIPATANQQPQLQTVVIVKMAVLVTAITVTVVPVIATRAAAIVIQKNAAKFY